MTSYCTLADVRAELKSTSADTSGDALSRRAIQSVSRRIDSTMGQPRWPFFAPSIGTRKYPIEQRRVDSYYNTFWMDDHCLSLTTVTRGTTAVTAYAELFTANNRVAQHIRLTNWYYTWYGDNGCSTDNPPTMLTVVGVWGWHEDYTNAWTKVDDVLDAGGISASATSITVADADGADLDGFTPRFSAGNLLKIESEFLEVTATNTTTNVLTVKRGVNGSTAAIHALNADISTYQVDERIRRIATRQAALLVARQGSFQVETLDGVGVVSYPQDLLSELKGVLTEFQYV